MSSTLMLNSLGRLITFKRLLTDSCKRNCRRMPIEGRTYNFTYKYLFARIMENFLPRFELTVSWYTFLKSNRNFYNFFFRFFFFFLWQGYLRPVWPERTNLWAHNPQHMRHINPMECRIHITSTITRAKHRHAFMQYS